MGYRRSRWLFLATTALSLFVAAAIPRPAAAQDLVGVLQTGSQAGHYLSWQGDPILPIGDSLTQGWQWTGANLDYQGYVDALASRGINTTMIWSYMGATASSLQGDSRIGYDSPEYWPWAGSPDNGSFDVTQFNQTYFDSLKSFVAYAEQKSVLVLITVHDGGAKWSFGGGHPFNDGYGNGPLTAVEQYTELHDYDNEMPATYDASWTRQQKNQYFQERFCEKLISELQPYSNVMYEMFNEGRKPYDDTQRKRHEEHFMAFFKARGDNVVFTNADHIDAGYDPHSQPNADVVSWHGDWGDRFADFQGGFNQAPAMPYFQTEPVPGWDGTNLTIDEIRAGMWQVVMAGAGWVAQNDASFGWDPNATIASQAAVRDSLYDTVGICSRFFNGGKVHFWNMKPDGSLSETGICLAEEGREYVVYAPDGGTFWLDLSGAGTDEFTAQWYDPRTGQWSAARTVEGGALRSFTAPDGQDWVLHVTPEPSSVGLLLTAAVGMLGRRRRRSPNPKGRCVTQRRPVR